MDQYQVRMQKAVLWEQAKGALRAMVAAEAFRQLCQPLSPEMERHFGKQWENLDAAIEGFITHAEAHGWHE